MRWYCTKGHPETGRKSRPFPGPTLMLSIPRKNLAFLEVYAFRSSEVNQVPYISFRVRNWDQQVPLRQICDYNSECASLLSTHMRRE